MLYALCDRLSRQRGPAGCARLIPDSIQQKLAQTVASRPIAPGCVQFWEMKNVSTRPGPQADTGEHQVFLTGPPPSSSEYRVCS